MNLNADEICLFFKIFFHLLWTINEKHQVVDHFTLPVYGNPPPLPLENLIKVRDNMWDNPQWIDDYLNDHASELTEEERGIVTDWRRHFILDKFIIVKHLAKYSVFLKDSSPARVYGVIGISDPISEYFQMISPPILLNTVLLPFKNKIIYDSFFMVYNTITFGPGLRASFKSKYQELKNKFGVIEQLGITPEPILKKETRSKAQPLAGLTETVKIIGDENVPVALVAKYNPIAEIISRFCDERLTDDLKALCLRALAKLARKRPSPLLTGKPITWAAGLTYAIGSINFVFDKSKSYYLSGDEFANWYGLSKKSVSSKAQDVKKLLNLSYFSSEFTIKDILAGFPMFFRPF
ncbi:MAG: DUF6398 domain-containing protein [Deltaproteobacteria bacterium]|jgi:hypothetical protein|nr:DUF6398 domain-containing protein [Deltaproteobacteria bacterium]